MVDKTEQVPLGTTATIESILGLWDPHMIGFLVAWMDHEDLINGDEDRQIQEDLVKLASCLKSLSILFPEVVRKDELSLKCPVKVVFVPVLERILYTLETMAQFYEKPEEERDDSGFTPGMFRDMARALEKEMERYG